MYPYSEFQQLQMKCLNISSLGNNVGCSYCLSCVQSGKMIYTPQGLGHSVMRIYFINNLSFADTFWWVLGIGFQENL